MKIVILIATILFISSCSSEKKYEVNGKTIDEKYLLWEFASKLEEQEYRLQGFNLEHHMQQDQSAYDLEKSLQVTTPEEHSPHTDIEPINQ